MQIDILDILDIAMLSHVSGLILNLITQTFSPESTRGLVFFGGG